MNISQQIRELAAAGHDHDTIAERLGLHPWRVSQALARAHRPGRPGGTASVAVQIKYARRIAESAKDATARALAEQLLTYLQAQR